MGQYSLITPQHMYPAHLIRLQLISGTEGILSDAFFQKDEMVDVKGTPQIMYLARLLIIVPFIAVTYQGSRLVGTMYQMNRGGGKIKECGGHRNSYFFFETFAQKGACVTYDYATRRLLATPFRYECLNPNDYLLLVSSSLTIGLFVVANFVCLKL